jgi:hypothetical protein
LQGWIVPMTTPEIATVAFVAFALITAFIGFIFWP